MKKILFVTTTYILKNSSAAIRNNSLVKGLIDLGYDVDVCSVEWPHSLSSPFFAREKNGNIYLDQLPNLMRIAKFKQSQIQKKDNKWISKIRQILKKILFFPDECYEWKKIFNCENLGQYACLISSSDHKTSHFVGLRVKRQCPSLPWIQIWGDPWSTDVNTLFLMKKLAAYHEEKLLALADKIVYVSDVTKREMQVKYPKLSSKMYSIPRGFYFGVNSSCPTQHCIRIVYTGVLSYGRNPFALLDTLAKLELISSAKFVVDFYGDISADMKESLKVYPFVKLHESVDFEYMPEILASASILLYLSNKKGSSQIPGKLFDYMGTDKPILCLVSDLSEPTSLYLKQFERCVVLNNSATDILNNWGKIEALCRRNFMPEVKFSPKYIASDILSLL